MLFCLPPELSHSMALSALNLGGKLGLNKKILSSEVTAPVTVMGIEFPNPVGMAAGLDKDGDYLEGLSTLGFGFLEIGTVTPRSQDGNPRPRLFRLPKDRALINRMGFNNKGVEHLREKLEHRPRSFILGVNIGKNYATPLENALRDYIHCLRQVYTLADYVTVNISSPNTPGLRHLQFGDMLDQLLSGIKAEQLQLAQQHDRYTPIAVKVAPDVSDEELNQLSDTLLRHQVDAVIATNTTTARQNLSPTAAASEAGGLSGVPLEELSTEVLRKLHEKMGEEIPLIGVGGISSAAAAKRKFDAGAKLVQLYTGFIYEGPKLINNILNELPGLDR